MSLGSRTSIAIVALGSFATMWVAFQFRAYDTHSPFAWVPMGVYAALLVTQGSRFWPALAAGAIAAAVVDGRPLLMILPGTATAVLAPWLLARYFEFRQLDRDLGRSRDVLRFAGVTLLVSAIPPTLVTALMLPTHSGVADVLRPWVNWWLCSTIGIALLVPMALGLTRGAWRSLSQQPWLALALLALAVVFIMAAYQVPAPVRRQWLAPAAIVITVISAIRLGTTVTAIIATIMTVGFGFAVLPPDGANLELADVGNVWAFGIALTAMTLTIHVLLAQRQEAQQNLRAAEFAHRMEVLDAARAEQERLGREMHDALGQELTAVSLLAHSLLRRLDAQRPDIIDDARSLVETADQAHRTARDIARGMAPRFTDGDDIGPALRALGERIGRTSRVAIEVDIDPGPTLQRHVAETLYRIAQEALSNALNHAKATRIDLRLRRDGDQCRLEIADNGRGFDQTAVAAGHGLGLRTMRYRCELAGGNLRIDSSPQAGTRITAALPLGLHAGPGSPADASQPEAPERLPTPSPG
ncbi:MAG: ATP-binding protein [Steroidobacteraceae bacterium]